MKILWVKADKILPVHSGGNIRSFHIARQLASSHQLTFFSYYGGMVDAAYESELAKQFPGAVCVATGKPEGSGGARALDYLLRLPNVAPYAVSRFGSASVQSRLEADYGQRRFDVVVCDFLDAAVNFPQTLTIPTVLFQHNVESEIWRRHVENESNPARKLMYKLEFGKMLRYEREVVRKFDHVIAVSEHDRELMSAWVDASRITVVPTGVDLQQYKFDPQVSSKSPLVMFVGAMDWEPNIDAVEHFCRDIWPSVCSAVPGAKFRIVGRNPDRRVMSLVSESIEVTGRVPSVVDHLRESAVFVVPLRVGGGTRLKIYEAMAMGKAVVSTTVGAEGLDVHHGQDVILADDARSFSESVVMLLQDRELRRKYERAAAQLAAQYDWPAIGRTFGQVLEGVAGSMPAGASSCVAAPV